MEEKYKSEKIIQFEELEKQKISFIQLLRRKEQQEGDRIKSEKAKKEQLDKELSLLSSILCQEPIDFEILKEWY
jgi:hypothetical protein